MARETTPQIKKTERIWGAHITLRNVDEDDAAFIFGLRTDPIKGRYLSDTPGSVDDQIDWILRYLSGDGQAYFIICDQSDQRLGCVRMYNASDSSYEWGSWLLSDGVSPIAALESVLLIYAYGKNLGFTEARIEVRQDNRSVWLFHEKVAGATLIGQTEGDRFYLMSGSAIDLLLEKFRHLISE